MSTIARDNSDNTERMVFDPVSEQQRKEFFRQGYGAHVPGYTGHCPTLKFRVGKRYGANTEEIMKELLEKKILKTGPYRPSSGRDTQHDIPPFKENRRDWKNEAHLYKVPPYIVGYTGYIPGFNNIYGLPFMRAVEQGAKDWHKAQIKLRTTRDTKMERAECRNLQSRPRADNVDVEIDHGHDRDRTTFDYQVSPDWPPTVGYTGYIPGARNEVDLSERYGQAARKGLELVHKEREQRRGKVKGVNAEQRVLSSNIDTETHRET